MLNREADSDEVSGDISSPLDRLWSAVSALKKNLSDAHISTIADRPGVGQNMWNQVLFPVTHKFGLVTTSILEHPVQANIAPQMYSTI